MIVLSITGTACLGAFLGAYFAAVFSSLFFGIGAPFGLGGIWENRKDPTTREWLRTLPDQMSFVLTLSWRGFVFGICGHLSEGACLNHHSSGAEVRIAF
jgi:hypothetical protein